MELVESNLSILRQNDAVLDTFSSLQGDATDLSGFADDAFDVTLLFGPCTTSTSPAPCTAPWMRPSA